MWLLRVNVRGTLPVRARRPRNSHVCGCEGLMYVAPFQFAPGVQPCMWLLRVNVYVAPFQFAPVDPVTAMYVAVKG